MSDMIFKDSKNRYHQVCMQFYENSCGPACAAMVERIYKHLSGSDEARTRALSQKYPGGWRMTSGASEWNISSVLNAEGVPTYAATNVTFANVYAYLKFYASFNTPVILTVTWNTGTRHCIVCAIYDSDDTFVFYDPFYGITEEQGYKFPWYYGYGGAQTPMSSGTGWFDGWLIITHH